MYNTFKDSLKRRFRPHDDQEFSSSYSGQAAIHIASAAAAGGFTDVITNPLWVVRTRLMSQHMNLAPGQAPPYQGSWPQTLWTIKKREGTRALYRGLSASFLGLSHVMVQFPVYEILKERLPSLNGRPGSKPGTADLIMVSAPNCG